MPEIRPKTLLIIKRLRIQRHRPGAGLFSWAWIPDMTIDKLMVAEVTIFGISFVWLGTAY